MKIGIYIGSRGAAFGGAENTVAVLAAALRERHPVEIISSNDRFNLEQLASNSGTDLRGVGAKYAPFDFKSPKRTDNPLASYARESGWNASLSRGYDLFINIANVMPPFCHAEHGVLRIFFPWQGVKSAKGLLRNPRTFLRQKYRHWLWLRRLRSYEFRLANSRFTQKWTRQLWGVDCGVINPPVDTRFGIVEKANLIVSVGRFSVRENVKKQLEMMQVFQRLKSLHRAGWEYRTLGGLLDDPEDRQYFESVSRAAADVPGHALPNVKRSELKQSIGSAKIFWHAAGLGEDEEKNPGSAEHFGQSTVEAMAAGCVPVVINRGGQPEIVEHGVSGFVWDTLDEMEHFTLLLANDEALRRKMAAAARERALFFSREEFARRFLELLSPILR